ncbi:MAG: hypothetical protein EP335_15460 [Alphaproteobacteria bacterium]|nr:MAG: hypothetical protein EP335_15460 [Alphaproteobacteria bacterium]
MPLLSRFTETLRHHRRRIIWSALLLLLAAPVLYWISGFYPSRWLALIDLAFLGALFLAFRPDGKTAPDR